jgi:hypothetical protein
LLVSWLAIQVALVVTPTIAVAAVPEGDRLREGLTAYDGLEYERAIGLLEAALKESLTRDERVSALRTIAQAQFALGRETEVRAALERLLRVDPTLELDRRQPPRLRQLLEETRAKLATQPAPHAPEVSTSLPSFTITGPDKARDGEPLRFHAAAGQAARMQLYHRVPPGAYSLVEASRADAGYEAIVPGADVHAPRVEYYALLLDGASTPLARAGSLGAPLALRVEARKKPVYKKAWFWGTIVGVAPAGALAAALAVTLRRAPDAALTLQPH